MIRSISSAETAGAGSATTGGRDGDDGSGPSLSAFRGRTKTVGADEGGSAVRPVPGRGVAGPLVPFGRFGQFERERLQIKDLLGQTLDHGLQLADAPLQHADSSILADGGRTRHPIHIAAACSSTRSFSSSSCSRYLIFASFMAMRALR